MNDPRHSRDYETINLPTLVADFSARYPDSKEDELRRFLYAEVCSSWRTLTEVRFKLLGLIPIVSAAILINLLARPKDPDTGLSQIAQTAIVVFGFVVTVALWIYDRRNDELYGDLLERGKRIEQELGIDTGIFLGRKQRSRRAIPVATVLVGHQLAVNIVYAAAITAWMVAVPIIWLKG